MNKSSFRLAVAMILVFSSSVSAAPAFPPIPIVIDGALSDWMGYQPFVINTDVGHGSNITRLWATNDDKNLYLLVERDPNMIWSSSVVLDLDRNPATGFRVGSIGIEAGVSLPGFPGQIAFVGDARDGSYSSSEFPGAVQWSSFDRWFECSVPLYILRAIEPGTTGFMASISAWSDATGTFNFVPVNTVPNPASLTCLAIGLAMFAGVKRYCK